MKQRSPKSSSRTNPFAEPLERRTLMSGTWSTVYSDPNGSLAAGMVADKSGNVYAITAVNGGSTLMKESGGQWTTIVTQDNANFNSMAIDSAGNVFIAGNTDRWTIWELPAGQSSLSQIDSTSSMNQAIGIGVDGAGNIYATGEYAVYTTVKLPGGKTQTRASYSGEIRKLTPGSSGFIASTVYQNGATVFNWTASQDVSVIASGGAAGIYAVGAGTNAAGSASADYWDVLKSTDGGAHWSAVDQFHYDANESGSDAYTVTGDGLGNVYVAGIGAARVLAGYTYTTTKVKGQLVTTATPQYNYPDHWIVRESATGDSGSWSISDDFLPTGFADCYPYAIGADLGGNIYVAGGCYSDDVLDDGQAFLRTNTGGSWSTSDDFAGPAGSSIEYGAFAADSLGNLFASGEGYSGDPGTFIRSMPGPAPAQPAATFSSVAIAGGSTTIDAASLLDSITPGTEMLA